MGGFGFSSSSSSSSSLPSFRFPSGPSGSSSFFGSEPATIFGPSAPIPTPFGPSSVPATTSIPLFGPPSTGHDTFGPVHPLFGPEDPTFKLSGPSSTPSQVLFGSSNPVSAQPSFFSFGPAQSSSMVGSTTSTTATTVSSRSSGGGGGGGGDGFAAALAAQPSLFSFGPSVGPAQSSSMVGSTTSTATTTVSSYSSGGGGGGGFAAALATYSAAMSSGFSAAASSGTITAPVTSSVAVSSTTAAASLASQSEANAALHSVGELPSDIVKMTEEVGNKTSGHSSCASEVFDGYADEFGLSPDSKQLIPCPQKGLSIQNCHFINQILLKYGDITKGSILKSVEARTTFLKFVAEVVALLSSNTLESIGAHEIETMQNWIDDAASVGFHVEWLQQRIKRVAANSKYRESSVRLNEVSEEINAAKLALSKLELEQMALKKDVDLMETEIDGNEDFRSDLCEGLL